MMTKQQAQEAVTTELRSRCQIPGDSFTIIENLTMERPFGWVFFYDSRKYLETGNIDDAIAGNGPVLVNKHTGAIELFGGRRPPLAIIAEYEQKLAGGMRYDAILALASTSASAMDLDISCRLCFAGLFCLRLEDPGES